MLNTVKKLIEKRLFLLGIVFFVYLPLMGCGSDESDRKSQDFGISEEGNLAVYEIVNGDLGNVKYLEDANGINADQYQEVWTIFTQLISQPYRSYITQYTIFSDGSDGLPAQMAALNSQYNKFNLLFNLDFGYTNNQLNVFDTKYILLHEFGHILTLHQSQFVSRKPKDQATPEEIAACEAHYVDEGCLKQDSYFNAFFQKFWVDLIHERLETPLDGPAYLDGDDPFYDRHQDQFITAYAATEPGEDIAESWTEFVMSERPENNSTINRKILFFYDYPELVRLRDYAQLSLQK